MPTQSSKNNNLFIISGPSGAGEDSVIKKLKKYFQIVRVITTVTRKPRPSESDGHPYYFISNEKFKTKFKNNEFIESANVYGNLYGVTFDELKRVQEEIKIGNKIGIWKIDWQGVKTAKEKLSNITAIMIEPPSLESLEKRLVKRGDPIPVIKERLEITKIWLENKNIYDYRVVNYDNKLTDTVKKVAKIIEKQTK